MEGKTVKMTDICYGFPSAVFVTYHITIPSAIRSCRNLYAQFIEHELYAGRRYLYLLLSGVYMLAYVSINFIILFFYLNLSPLWPRRIRLALAFSLLFYLIFSSRQFFQFSTH